MFTVKLLRLFADTGNAILKNRLLNKHTPKGLLLLIAGGYAFKALDAKEVNLLISLLSGANISWVDIYIFVLNVCVIFLIGMGLWFVFAKVKQKIK